MSALLTELEAVNLIRASIGDAPVSTLAGATDPDVISAQSRLINATKEIQVKSRWFNIEREVTLTPDVDGFIYVPANAHEVRTYNPYDFLILLGQRMYNPRTQSYVFEEPVKFDMLMIRTWDELPYVAANYAQYVAARKHQSGYDGDPTRIQDLRDDEGSALVALNQAESRNRRQNSLFSSGSLRMQAGINTQANYSRNPIVPGG